MCTKCYQTPMCYQTYVPMLPDTCTVLPDTCTNISIHMYQCYHMYQCVTRHMYQCSQTYVPMLSNVPICSQTHVPMLPDICTNVITCTIVLPDTCTNVTRHMHQWCGLKPLKTLTFLILYLLLKFVYLF